MAGKLPRGKGENGASRERRVGTPEAQSLMTAMRTPVMVTNVPIIQRK